MLKKFIKVAVNTKIAKLNAREGNKKIIGIAVHPSVSVEEIKKCIDEFFVDFHNIVYTKSVSGIQKFYEGDEENWNKLQN